MFRAQFQQSLRRGVSLLLHAEACLQPRRAAADLRARSLHGKAARPQLGHCAAEKGETYAVRWPG
jgi:hypothetical protein